MANVSDELFKTSPCAKTLLQSSASTFVLANVPAIRVLSVSALANLIDMNKQNCTQNFDFLLCTVPTWVRRILLNLYLRNFQSVSCLTNICLADLNPAYNSAMYIFSDRVYQLCTVFSSPSSLTSCLLEALDGCLCFILFFPSLNSGSSSSFSDSWRRDDACGDFGLLDCRKVGRTPSNSQRIRASYFYFVAFSGKIKAINTFLHRFIPLEKLLNQMLTTRDGVRCRCECTYFVMTPEGDRYIEVVFDS